MPLAAGTRLGPYEVLGPIGAGGMGEVYKARDTRLDRTVAIKILPAELSADPERRTRLEREARAVAALSHPHICMLHDIGTHDGTTYLVMEHLAGESLAQRLMRGPLPVAQALELGTQIADALDAAHKHGIIHRDLKPGNVMLTRGGSGRSGVTTAKLLDFGLAKLAAHGERPALAGGASVPTQAAPVTAEGTILGTLQYMAPEQLEGKEADARTDLWALGALLYEMVTGARAFEGESAVSLIGAILEREPTPIAARQPLVPLALDRLVRQCLAKAPDDRPDTAHDFANDLRGIRETVDMVGAVGPPASVASKWRRMLPWGVAAAMTVIAVIAVALTLAGSRVNRESLQPPIYKFMVQLPEGNSVSGDALAVSPGGRWVAYSATSQGRTLLWVQDLQTATSRSLEGTDGATFPFWSPDGRFIGFFSQGKLKKIDVSAGTVHILSDAPFGVGGAWGPDGLILFSPNFSSGLSRVSANGGDAVAITTLDVSNGETTHRWPLLLPDGRHFVYFVRSDRQEATGVYLGTVDSKPDGAAKKPLLKVGSMAVYAPPGYLLFARDRTLMVQRFDASRLELAGDPFPVAEQLISSTVYGLVPVSVSAGGVLVYRAGQGSSQLAWFDREGKVIQTLGEPGVYRFPDLSADERWLAVERQEPNYGSSISLLDLRHGNWRRFTIGSGSNRSPIWAPGGQSIVFVSNDDGFEGLYQQDTAGMSGPRLLLRDTDRPWDWRREGGPILYSRMSSTTGYDIWALEPGRDPAAVLQTPFNEWQARLSPGGELMAYSSDASGTFEVYVQSYPATASHPQKWQVSSGGGMEPRWRKDGAEFFYIAADGRLMVQEMKGLAQASVARSLFQTHIAGFRGYEVHYAVSNDGKRFLINVPASDAATLPITVEVNWTERLKSQ